MTLLPRRAAALLAPALGLALSLGALTPANGTLPTEATARAQASATAESPLKLKRVDDALVITGSKVAFEGFAPKKRAGSRVVLQRRVGAKGDWVAVATTKVGAKGGFDVSGVATGVGVNSWRLVLPTKKKGETLVSETRTHKVFAWFYLAELDKVASNRFTSGSAAVGGRTYSKSVFNSSDFWWDHDPYAEWNLSYRCDRFEASVGINDQAPTGMQVSFNAYLDGAQTAFGTKGLGSASDVVLDVSSRLRLKLEDVYVAGPTSSGQGHHDGVWGNARVLCSALP